MNTVFADASFVVVQVTGLREAPTTDHHFQQAGFVALLNSPIGSTHRAKRSLNS